MTVKQIVERAAYEVGDDLFKQIPKDQYLKFLRRVYRDYCEQTKILRNFISFTTTAGSKEYKLYGPDVDAKIFGDNFLGTQRAEYNGRKAFEVDLDTYGILTYDDQVISESTDIFYALQYVQEYLWVMFKHSPNTGDVFKLWYYEMPILDSFKELGVDNWDATPMFDIKHHDDLVLGLVAKAWHRLFVLTVGKDKSLARLYKEEADRTKVEWVARCHAVAREVASYKDDSIPLVMRVSTPFSDDTGFDQNVEELGE